MLAVRPTQLCFWPAWSYFLLRHLLPDSCHWIGLLPELATTFRHPSTPGYWDGRQSLYCPNLCCRELSSRHSRRFGHELANVVSASPPFPLKPFYLAGRRKYLSFEQSLGLATLTRSFT